MSFWTVLKPKGVSLKLSDSAEIEKTKKQEATRILWGVNEGPALSDTFNLDNW